MRCGMGDGGGSWNRTFPQVSHEAGQSGAIGWRPNAHCHISRTQPFTKSVESENRPLSGCVLITSRNTVSARPSSGREEGMSVVQSDRNCMNVPSLLAVTPNENVVRDLKV